MKRYLFFSLSLGFVFLSNLGISPALSQTTLLEDDRPSSERDTFSSGLGEGISPFDLIHSINSSQGMTLDEYRNQQQRNLDSAASEFRQQQQRLLQEQSSQNPEEGE